MNDFDGIVGRFRGDASSNNDLFALLLFIAIAGAYFIAPVIGYHPEGRSRLAYALYFLIVYSAMSLVQVFIYWSEFTDPGGAVGGREGLLRRFLAAFGFLRGNEPAQIFLVSVYFLVSLLKTVFFLGAMVTFVSGLRSLRLRQSSAASNADAGHDEDVHREE